MSKFVPSDGILKGKSVVIPIYNNDNVEADSEDEAKQKAQEKISKKDFKDEKGCTEYSVAYVKIIN
jgi:hypothetical protein